MTLEHRDETNPPSPTSRPTPSALPPEALALATRLFDLARGGATAELQAYVSAGVPADLTNHAGDTLLMLAAYHGHAGTVAMLLGRGADPDAANARGQTPLAGAVFKGSAAVVRALLDAGADPRAGRPSALGSAVLFRRDEYLAWFGVEAAEVEAERRAQQGA